MSLFKLIYFISQKVVKVILHDSLYKFIAKWELLSYRADKDGEL